MKTFTLLPALLLVAACQLTPCTASAAEPAPAPARPAAEATSSPQVRMDLCKAYASLARAIMRGRQDGGPLDGAMEVAKDSPQAQTLLVAAYELPRYSTPERQQRQVEDFGNDVYLACLKEATSG